MYLQYLHYFQFEGMIGDSPHNFDTFLIFNLKFKFFKEKNSSNQLRLGLLLGEQIFQGSVMSINSDLATQEILKNLSKENVFFPKAPF